MEEGVAPWQKPWKTGFPKNLITKKEYRGINSFLLNLSSYDSPHWLTFKQVKQLGGYVKTGEKATSIVFWTTLQVDDINEETGEPEDKQKQVPFLRYYSVFNAEQCMDLKNVPAPEKRQIDFSPIEFCDQIVREMPHAPAILTKAGDKPGLLYAIRRLCKYASSGDVFISGSLLQHAVPRIMPFDRACNEVQSERHRRPQSVWLQGIWQRKLIAEMGASFLCGIAGIEMVTLDNSAAYLSSWLKTIRGDKKMVICAAAAAQRAVDYIMGKQSGE